MKIGIIGTGNMATSLIKGFQSQKKNKIYCFDLDSKKLSFFKKAGGVKIATNNKEVVEKSEIIFFYGYKIELISKDSILSKLNFYE